MNPEPNGIQELAEAALDRGDFEAAVAAASLLVEGGQPSLLDGLSLRAFALEHWTDGPPDRLIRAADDWRRFVEIAPAQVSYLGLARVLLRLGERDAGFENLLEAQRIKQTPEVLLGFAHYYRTASPPDIPKAKRYFLRAALRGRTQGMRGYAEVAYEQNHFFSCVAMILAATIATPLLALMLGERRHAGF